MPIHVDVGEQNTMKTKTAEIESAKRNAAENTQQTKHLQNP